MRDLSVLGSYGQLYVLFLRHHARAASSAGAEVVLYHLPRYAGAAPPKGRWEQELVDTV